MPLVVGQNSRSFESDLKNLSMGDRGPSRREILASGLSLALASFGCSASTSKKPLVPAPSKRSSLEIAVDQAIAELTERKIAIVEHVNPEKPISKPAFFVGFHHFNPNNPRQPLGFSYLEYHAIEALVRHGFKRVGCEGIAYGKEMVPGSFKINTAAGSSFHQLSAGELRQMLRDREYFDRVVSDFYRRKIEGLPTIVRSALDGMATVTGLEKPELINKVMELQKKNWERHEVVLIKVAERLSNGQRLRGIVGGKSIRIGPEVFDIKKLKAALEYVTASTAITDEYNRKRERQALEFDLNVYLLGYDHLKYIQQASQERSVFLVHVAGSKELEIVRARSDDIFRDLLTQINNAERMETSQSSSKNR